MAAPTIMRKPAPPMICAMCNGPRSVSATSAFCRRCFLANRKPQGRTAQIVALQIDVAALRAELAALKDHVKDAFAEVCEFVGMTGKGR